jgi:hypothetical protein
MLIETSVFLLILLLTLILSYYNHRQARAIEAVRDMAEDMVAMQIKDRRAKYQQDAQDIQAEAWVKEQVALVTDRPVEIATYQLVEEVQAIDVTLKDGGRVVITPLGEAELKRHDRRQKGGGRLAMFAANSIRPVLPRRYTQVSRTLLDDEFLDIKAEAVANKLALDWRSPARLWFYVA